VPDYVAAGRGLVAACRLDSGRDGRRPSRRISQSNTGLRPRFSPTTDYGLTQLWGVGLPPKRDFGGIRYWGQTRPSHTPLHAWHCSAPADPSKSLAGFEVDATDHRPDRSDVLDQTRAPKTGITVLAVPPI